MTVLAAVLSPLTSNSPSGLLIRQTAKRQWKILSINVGSSLFEAFSEGITLGLIFLSIEVVSTPSTTPFDWASVPYLSSFPLIISWLALLSNNVSFLFLLIISLITQALQSFSRYLNMVSVGYFSSRVKSLITSRIHSQILSFSFPCASSYKIGDLLDYASSGPEAIRVYIDQTSSLLVLIFLLLTYLFVLCAISPWLLIAALVIGLVLAFVQKNLLPSIRQGSESVTAEQVALSSAITDDFQGLRLLHTTGMLVETSVKVSKRLILLESKLREQVLRLSVITPLTNFLPILAIVSIATLSLVFLGNKSTGLLPSLITFVLALQRLTIRFGMAANILSSLADNLGRMNRLDGILGTTNKEFRPLGGVPFITLTQSIAFDNVSLKYPQCSDPALNHVSFNLEKGQKLALVGPSGAGKSSIADLLTGLYSPSSGHILIDGLPLKQYDLTSWQKKLGVVSQDTFMFNCTIRDNLLVSSPDASLHQIETACDAAQATEFILNLPDGFDTHIGERGFRLSGGQRQRISLARAILRQPSLLILDEATSALDTANESLVQSALESLDDRFTVLTIAHRLSTIIRSDMIIVLDAGIVREQGTHSSLLAEGGIYANLWDLQQK